MSATGAGEIVFRDVRVFDGRSDRLSDATDVTVAGNVIRSIAKAPPARPGDGTTVISGRGRVLMPGLIDAHAHLAFATIPLPQILLASAEFVAIRGA